MQVALEGVSSFTEFDSTSTDEIQGKHIQGTAFGEQQLRPVTHADVPPHEPQLFEEETEALQNTNISVEAMVQRCWFGLRSEP